MSKVKITLNSVQNDILQRLANKHGAKCEELVQSWVEDILEELSEEN